MNSLCFKKGKSSIYDRPQSRYTFSIYFDPVENKWESDLITMDTYNGNFYLAVRFGYAGRTVLSPNSDSFNVEGEEPNNTNLLEQNIDSLPGINYLKYKPTINEVTVDNRLPEIF